MATAKSYQHVSGWNGQEMINAVEGVDGIQAAWGNKTDKGKGSEDTPDDFLEEDDFGAVGSDDLLRIYLFKQIILIGI